MKRYSVSIRGKSGEWYGLIHEYDVNSRKREVEKIGPFGTDIQAAKAVVNHCTIFYSKPTSGPIMSGMMG